MYMQENSTQFITFQADIVESIWTIIQADYTGQKDTYELYCVEEQNISHNSIEQLKFDFSYIVYFQIQ